MIPNKGTSSAQPAMAPTPGDAADTKPKVLVVDDVFDNRDILTRRLVRRGFDVVEAAGGVEALEKIENETFDIVLLDIMMPDMSGNEVLEVVRKTKSARELPVIMVTAKSQSEDVAQSLSLGANDYVTKPVDFVVALARINAQLESKKQADCDRADKAMVEEQAKEKKRESDEKLHYLAYHDALTGLMNRTAFRELISDALLESGKPSQEPTVLFIDLDRFKAVNDVHGHEIGDKLLVAVAERLLETAGTGAKIARLGGDEFGAFLFEDKASSPSAGFDLAERIVESATRPFVIDGNPFQIGASCGVARASDCGNELEQMLKGADLAMYEAKAAGRARPIVFEPRMLEEQRERNALEVDLRRAIETDELEVFYQPLVNTETSTITAFEALVRWNHPERGMIPPDRFIGIAEDTGLIIHLGKKILRMACVEALTWPEEIRVAVNLSPLQFRDPELLASIQAILAETGLPATRLELEITETGLLEAGEHNLEILRTIRDLGIRVSMDDFGTGYSSMSYLQNFEFDKIKIDQRFIRDLKNGHNGAAIIKAIIDLGVNAGIDTSAEGVETSEELESIQSQGCVEMQGYFFSRPVNSAGVLGFIEKYLGWGRKSDQDQHHAPFRARHVRVGGARGLVRMAAHTGYDVVIVGGAIMGATLAWFLSSDPDFDGRVLVVERDPTYTNSSTMHTTSCIRQQFSHALNVRISQFGAEFITGLRGFMGGDERVPEIAIRNFGYMYLAGSEARADELRRDQAVQVAAGAATRLMTTDEIAAAYPFYRLDDVVLGSINTVDEGYWDATAVFDWLRRKGREQGVEYLTGEVVAMTRGAGGRRVESVTLASGEVISCGQVVNASGPRAARTAAMAGIDLPVEPRKRYSWIFQAETPLDRDLPLTVDMSGIHVREAGGGTYQCGGHGVDDPAVEPDDFAMDQSLWEEHVWPALAWRIPQFEAIKVTSEWAGHYAWNVLDRNAVLGPHDEVENFWFMNGFSGHGLQQAPAMGRGLAELLVHREFRSLDLSPFGFGRIREGRGIVEAAII